MPQAFYVEQDGPVTLHTFTDSSEAAIDAWALAVVSLMESALPHRPFLLLMDVSSPQVSFTRYARDKTLALFSHYGQREGRLAFLFTSKVAPYYARIFFASLGKLTFETKYFSSRPQAVAWLRAGETSTLS
jgi:hypothetical protein